MYQMICSVLEEMGFVVLDDGEDFDITDYIVDSLQFISFIVSIENSLGATLPDDFLSIEMLKSARGLANKLSSFVETSV